MADRLTQLQDAINQQADNYTNSLGVLQQFATPNPFSSLGDKSKSSKNNNSNNNNNNNNSQSTGVNNNQQSNQTNEDHTALFAQLIARTAKDIEYLIDSLPGEESSAELQANSLKKLETENQESAEKLQKIVADGEAKLGQIQAALHAIAQAQLDIQKLES